MCAQVDMSLPMRISVHVCININANTILYTQYSNLVNIYIYICYRNLGKNMRNIETSFTTTYYFSVKSVFYCLVFLVVTLHAHAQMIKGPLCPEKNRWDLLQ